MMTYVGEASGANWPNSIVSHATCSGWTTVADASAVAEDDGPAWAKVAEGRTSIAAVAARISFMRTSSCTRGYRSREAPAPQWRNCSVVLNRHVVGAVVAARRLLVSNGKDAADAEA